MKDHESTKISAATRAMSDRKCEPSRALTTHGGINGTRIYTSIGPIPPYHVPTQDYLSLYSPFRSHMWGAMYVSCGISPIESLMA